ncbi:hypothetical protein ACFPJ1_33160 [Kribbella qitaiheensis]|uniref:hypothetical protein n=1 Tax=Kribbella qitaiheensis TaxID=1544730 RepID=UPI003620F678
MTSNVELPDEAPEADVVEQRLPSTGDDPEPDDDSTDVPLEADPADVGEQRRPVGGSDEDDYR